MAIGKSINLYFSLFVTTRNVFFQSLVFVSIGMLVAQMDCADNFETSMRSGLIVGFI